MHFSSCGCTAAHVTQRIVLTGGPGAGKTAVLEMTQGLFCPHVEVLPEAAGILFGGGFPRDPDDSGRRAVQRAVFHVQSELEQLTLERKTAAVALCDRGTLDGLAYWPGPEESYFRELHTSQAAELARYAAVLHLRTPSAEEGYNHRNPHRTETAEEAQRVDRRILEVWAGHPRRFIIPASDDFLAKARKAIDLISQLMPACCAPPVGQQKTAG